MPELTETITERRRLTRNGIYHYLYEAETPRTKQDIAQALALSMPTVHQNLSELMQAGLVEPGKLLRSTGGRRATGLVIAANARFAVGVSISQHHFRFLASNLRMEEIAFQKTAAFTLQDSTELGRILATALEDFLDRFGLNRAKLLGVGIAVPGILDAAGQNILFAPTLRLRGIPAAALTAGLPYPVYIANDASAGGYAEWLAQKDRASLAYLSLENGVGGAVLLNGAPYEGLTNRSAEFGHICVEPNGRLCQCGKRGCLEAYCSAARLSDDLSISIEDFFAGLEAHNPTHETIWRDYLQHLALGIHNIRMVLDCPVVLGGFLTQYMGPCLPELGRMVAALSPFGADSSAVRLCRYPKRALPLGVALHYITEFVETL